MRFLKRFHLHPYLIGIFPVLSLYAHNQSQLQLSAPWRSFAVVMAGTTIVLIILRFWFKDWCKAGFLATYASLIFFLYNPLREILYKVHTSNFNLGWNRYFFPLWLLILLAGSWLVLKKLPLKNSTTQSFNLIALSTLLLPAVSVITYLLNHYSINVTQLSDGLAKWNLEAAADAHLITRIPYCRWPPR
jgi:hypothetical protein